MMRATKIICTIGPASEAPAVLEKLTVSGMDIARFNLSFGFINDHLKSLASIRKLALENKKVVASLFDLSGPRVRVGEVEGEIVLEEGQELTLNTKPVPASQLEVSVNYPGLAKDVEVGQKVLIDEGKIVLKVFSRDSSRLYCKVDIGGTLLSGKGINLPGTTLSLPALTAKDKKDIEEVIKNKVDWVALSFVRTADDVLALRKLITKLKGKTLVMAKIEKHEAVKNIDHIIEAADGIMVARGDLGIELAPEEVPIIQKSIVRKCLRRGKPVVIATQMLESMVSTIRPTRAEASDVANAIFDETDAVLLSDETAVGAYPVEVLRTMDRLIRKTEGHINYSRELMEKSAWIDRENVTDAISFASCELSLDLRAKAIVSATQSGNTARRVSRFRPPVPIIAITPDETVINQLKMSWGVLPLRVKPSKDINDMFSIASKASLASNLLGKGDRVVITAGVMVNVPGTTNLIKVQEV